MSTFIKSTKFRNANLTDANFENAKLQNTDFRDANLTRTNWSSADNLERACVQGTYLQYSKVRELVVKRTGKEKNFDRLNLQGINCLNAKLQGASLIGTNLSEANLRGLIYPEPNSYKLSYFGLTSRKLHSLALIFRIGKNT